MLVQLPYHFVVRLILIILISGRVKPCKSLHNSPNMQRRLNRKNEIHISLEDVQLIMGKEYSRLDIFLSNVFCANCSDNTTIENYSIFLDDTNDVIFDGQCVKCKQPVARYIETGEGVSSREIAEHIRVIKKMYGSK